MSQHQHPSPHPEALIEMRGVTCGYGDRTILRDVDISLPRGKVIGVMGTSGGGKTTLLRLIGRQLSPLSGQVLFDGIDLGGLDRTAQFRLDPGAKVRIAFGAAQFRLHHRADGRCAPVRLGQQVVRGR